MPGRAGLLSSSSFGDRVSPLGAWESVGSDTVLGDGSPCWRESFFPFAPPGPADFLPPSDVMGEEGANPDWENGL